MAPETQGLSESVAEKPQYKPLTDEVKQAAAPMIATMGKAYAAMHNSGQDQKAIEQEKPKDKVTEVGR